MIPLDYSTRSRPNTSVPEPRYTKEAFGRRPPEEDKPSPEACELIDEISGYCSLEAGWDSRHAQPLSKQGARGVKAAVIALDDYIVDFKGCSLGVADDVDIRFQKFEYSVTVTVEPEGWDWTIKMPGGENVSGEFVLDQLTEGESFSDQASKALFDQTGIQ